MTYKYPQTLVDFLTEQEAEDTEDYIEGIKIILNKRGE